MNNKHKKNEIDEVSTFLENQGYKIIDPRFTGNSKLKEKIDFEIENQLITEKFSENEIPSCLEKNCNTITSEEDIYKIVDYLHWHIKRISQQVVGREDIIIQTFYALLTREHILLLSRTGMAKSYLANHIFNSFSDVRVFASQASKDQTPDNYFGAYNIDEFKKGKIRHNLHGSIVEANLVFLDEFFDASDVVLRSLLSILNERKFINGQEKVDAVVHTAIATANYMRLNEVTEAVMDRFVYKAIIPENSNSYDQFLIDMAYNLHSGHISKNIRRTPFELLKSLSRIVRNRVPEFIIEVPDDICFMKNVIVDRYVSEMRRYNSDYYISPRKQAKLMDLLRASAVMEKRLIVELDDLRNMYLSLCVLNSHVTVNKVQKLETDIYLSVYEQVMTHFSSTKGIEQIQFILEVRKILKEISLSKDDNFYFENNNSADNKIVKLFKKIFRTNVENSEITKDSLKDSLVKIEPVAVEVAELRDGVLREFMEV